MLYGVSLGLVLGEAAEREQEEEEAEREEEEEGREKQKKQKTPHLHHLVLKDVRNTTIILVPLVTVLALPPVPRPGPFNAVLPAVPTPTTVHFLYTTAHSTPRPDLPRAELPRPPQPLNVHDADPVLPVLTGRAGPRGTCCWLL